MQLNIKEIAAIIHAQIIGDETFIINKFSSFEDSDKHALTFASDFKFLKKLDKCRAGAVIIPEDYEIPDNIIIKPILLKTDNPKHKFFEILLIIILFKNMLLWQTEFYLFQNLLSLFHFLLFHILIS